MTFDAVLFDCDGVLVDSEPITNGVLRDMLEEAGWSLSSAECMRLFIGKAVRDEAALIEEKTGRPLTEAWMAEFRGRRNEGLVEGLLPIRGALEAVAQIHALYAGRIACASGADRFKVELQLEKCGLMPYFKDRIFSGHEMPRSKPAPDVYLAAAAALGVDPTRCAVVEDTVPGVMAGVAAGATVFGYSPAEAG
ncbi:HAD family hydrolase, partial [Polaromonas sp.]|uniref:HAD family hydrolase n=1 Tax=Polaromonas sp. TaxID=1869339 RepID=UPI00356890F4